jgi:hypothetical protein
MQLITHNFRRRMQRLSIYFLRRLDSAGDRRESPLAHERQCVMLCKKLAKMTDSVLLMTPLTDKRFLKNERLKIYVIMDSNQVQIIDNVHSYSVTLRERAWQRLIHSYNLEIEERRHALEADITANIRYSLKNLLDEIAQKH